MPGVCLQEPSEVKIENWFLACHSIINTVITLSFKFQSYCYHCPESWHESALTCEPCKTDPKETYTTPSDALSINSYFKKIIIIVV